jgi:site-specific DNA-methyltransferase (adenine-specific)
MSNANQKEKLHPTQKPIALFEYLIKTYTNKGETVLDNCIGSGTTAIAAINTNRNFIGFELDKHYCDIANERIQKALADSTRKDYDE